VIIASGLPLALQGLLHEGQGRGFIAFLRDEALQNLAFVIDRSPQINHLAIKLHVSTVFGLIPWRLARTLRLS
jgi:hypothetical protein